MGIVVDCSGSVCTNGRTLGELGAWGVQYSLNVRMALHSTGGVLTLDERAYCLNRAAWLASDVFCLECPEVPALPTSAPAAQ
jgi:hypothetical protein